jgi:predicted nicotinamide N-methyase
MVPALLALLIVGVLLQPRCAAAAAGADACDSLDMCPLEKAAYFAPVELPPAADAAGSGGGGGASGGDEPLPPLRIRQGEVLATDDEAVRTGGTLWPAATAVVRFLQRHPRVVRGRAVVELGAGTGACGLTAAQLGAAHVLLTDQHTELAAANIRDNGLSTIARVAQVDWTDRSTWGPVLDAGPPWDVAIASDVFFWPGLIPALTALLAELSAAGAGPTTVLVGYHHRSEVARQTMLREFENVGCQLHAQLGEVPGVLAPDVGESTNGSQSAAGTTGQYTQILTCEIGA